MQPKLRPPEYKRLKLKCDVLLSASAFEFNLRHYSKWHPTAATSTTNTPAATLAVPQPLAPPPPGPSPGPGPALGPGPGPGEYRVMSYNLLGDSYAGKNRMELYRRTDEGVLHWPHRLRGIVSKILPATSTNAL
jgi:hypothetical protein